MSEILGFPIQVLYGQLALGLVNGAFYAMLSLGLAIIFGLLNIINFSHGVLYMLGAVMTWVLLNQFGIGYWGALVLSPLIVGIIALAIERLLLRRIYKVDHIYGLLLTYGISLVIQGVTRNEFGIAGRTYEVPLLLKGASNLGFMYLPNYRIWVIGASAIVCALTWFAIEKTRLGVTLRAATENAPLTDAFGINVPRLIFLTYGFGAALAALTGVFAAPIYSINPTMGGDLMITAFAVVVIGGMGSILGAIITGFGIGLIEGLTKTFYAEGSGTVIFLVMVAVLLLKPVRAGGHAEVEGPQRSRLKTPATLDWLMFGALCLVLVVGPLVAYPIFIMKVMCFSLFAIGFSFLLNYSGLLSFGHAAYFGIASYASAIAAKKWGLPPEICVILGVLASTLLGALLGWIAIRRHGITFSMITLALAQMVYFVALQFPSVTGGEDGIQAVPRGQLFGRFSLADDMTLYVFISLVFLAAVLAVHRITTSPFGQVAKAIRGNEARAISLGYRADHYKLAVFVISAAVVGLGGAMKAIVFQLASLNDVHWAVSGEVILMTLAGGIATRSGPIIGAAAILAMQYYLAHIGAWLTIVQGLIFISCVLVFRNGIMGTVGARLRLPL
jgi:branched-chain amino acid transport system permease protein